LLKNYFFFAVPEKPWSGAAAVIWIQFSTSTTYNYTTTSRGVIKIPTDCAANERENYEVGRVGFEPTTPAMSRLIDDISSNNISSSGARGFESDSAIINWQQFHNFLLQRMTAKTAEDRLRYATQFARLLANGDAQSLLSASPNKRIHIMKSLSSLARFTGNTELWRQMRQRHGLAWSTGTEKIDAFTRFFDDSKSLDTMLQWLREAMRILPDQYANLFLFCTLTGLRASEAIESIRLLNIGADTNRSYYNPKQNVL